MFTNVRKMALGCYVLLRRRREPDARRRKFDREKLIYPFRLLFHPLAVFNDLKFEKKASLPLQTCWCFSFFWRVWHRPLPRGIYSIRTAA